MTFLIQFKRFRRGVPEVIGTLPIAAADGAAALAFARSLAGNETLATPDRCSACDGRWWPHTARLDCAGSDRAAGHLLTHPCSGEAQLATHPRRASAINGRAPRREPINARLRGAPLCCGTGRLLRGGRSARDLERRL